MLNIKLRFYWSCWIIWKRRLIIFYGSISLHYDLTREDYSFVRAVAKAAISFIARHLIYQRKKGRRRQINVRKLSTWLSARFKKITNSPFSALLHCCVSLSRMGRRGRHIPGAEASRRDPWKLDKLTTYASHSRTPPFRCSTFVSEGFLPSLFLVHLW